jgi:hypothetical protein
MATSIPPMVCNLDARGDRRRARVGVALTVVTIVVAAIVVLGHVLSPWWSLAVLPPAYGAALGFLQAKAST